MIGSPLMGKALRQQRISALVGRRPIRTQGELMQLLMEEGVAVDQSTLSRDLAELGVRKSGGVYCIVKDEAVVPRSNGLAGAVTAFSPCGPNLVVISTLVGQAHPVALAIEAMKESSVVATLAGDDTVFLATKSARTQAVAVRRLAQWFGDKQR